MCALFRFSSVQGPPGSPLRIHTPSHLFGGRTLPYFLALRGSRFPARTSRLLAGSALLQGALTPSPHPPPVPPGRGGAGRPGLDAGVFAATGRHSFQTLSAGEPGSGSAPKDLRVDTRFHRGPPHIYRGLTPVSTLCQPFPTWGTPAPPHCAVSPAPTETSPPPAAAGRFPTCSGSRVVGAELLPVLPRGTVLPLHCSRCACRSFQRSV